MHKLRLKYRSYETNKRNNSRTGSWNRDVVEFLGLWEILHNPNFKRVEFDTFKKDAGTNAYTFSIKEWNQNLNGIGIVTKSGRYGGGIFAHTDAIKENLIIPKLTPAQKSFVYADEADLLNVALFGKTAKEWRTENPKKKGNIRDYKSIFKTSI